MTTLDCEKIKEPATRSTGRLVALLVVFLFAGPLLAGCADALVSDGTAPEVQPAMEQPAPATTPTDLLPAHDLAPAPGSEDEPAQTEQPESRLGSPAPEATQQEPAFKMLRRF